MSRYKRVWRLGFGRRKDLERELDEEIQAHIEMRAEALEARGLPRDEALAEARRRFGDEQDARRRLLDDARRMHRRSRTRLWAYELLSDVALATRSARHTPGFAATAVTIFAVGVGLTTSMATVADHVLLRPLPYPQPDELVALWSSAEGGNEFRWVSMGNWVDWREAGALSSTALYSDHRASISTAEDAFHATTTTVRGAFFKTIGNEPLVGRFFTEAESQEEAAIAVVSEGFWRRVLGAGALATLPSLKVNGQARQVVGVVRQGAGYPSGSEIWIPDAWRPQAGAMRNNINFQAVARLRADATRSQARAELDAIASRIRTTDPDGIYSWGVGVHPLRDVVIGSARSYLVLLSVSVGLVLLVASANLAGLSLARSRRRERETAVHLALGAGRWALVRRVVVEHLVLAALGGTLGVALAWLTTDALLGRVAHIVPRAEEIGFDVRIAALGIAAALVSGVLAGLLPALRGSRGDLSTVLSGTRGGISGGAGLPGAVMVGAEIALAVALLVAGGLLARSLQSLVSRDLGFEAAGVVTGRIGLVGPEYQEGERRIEFWTTALERVRSLPGTTPGTTFAAVASAGPGGGGVNGFIDLPGQEGDDIGAGYRAVSEEYFDVLGIPLLAGRRFDASDEAAGERVVIVSRAMVDRYWPDVDPVGQRVRARSMEALGSKGPWLTVVGVVDDVRQHGFESDVRPDMYVLYRQVPYWARGMTILARGGAGVSVTTESLRATIRDIDPGLAVETAQLATTIGSLTEERRIVLSGLGVFGVSAILLVCLGIYGLMSFAAGERTREMAVRVALGSGTGSIVRLMLVSALGVVLLGGTAGLGAAWAVTRLMSGLLVDVAPTDPASYAAALALVAAVSSLAALGPSIRAARRDPLEALKSEA